MAVLTSMDFFSSYHRISDFSTMFSFFQIVAVRHTPRQSNPILWQVQLIQDMPLVCSQAGMELSSFVDHCYW